MQPHEQQRQHQQQHQQQQQQQQQQHHQQQYAPIGLSDAHTGAYGVRHIAPHPHPPIATGQILPPPSASFSALGASLAVPGQSPPQHGVSFYSNPYPPGPNSALNYQPQPMPRKRSRTDLGGEDDRRLDASGMPVIMPSNTYQQQQSYVPTTEHYYPTPQYYQHPQQQPQQHQQQQHQQQQHQFPQQQQQQPQQQQQQQQQPASYAASTASSYSVTHQRKPNQECMVGKEGFPPPIAHRGERARFRAEDDALLKHLKERPDYKLSWEQIADFFPGRRSGTLQVRYCTKLKAKGPVEWTADLEKKLLLTNHDYESDRWKSVAVKMGAAFSASICEEKFRELEERRQLEELHGPADPEATM